MGAGEKRALGSIDYNYSKYTEARKQKSKMSEYKNGINPRILQLKKDLSTVIKELFPEPKLYTLNRILTKFKKKPQALPFIILL